MVLISDVNSEIGAHLRSNLCYLICLRDLIRSRAVSYFLHASPTCSELPSNMSTMPNLFIFIDLIGRLIMLLCSIKLCCECHAFLKKYFSFNIEERSLKKMFTQNTMRTRGEVNQVS